MVTRLIYLLLFISPQVLLYLYLRERLPDPTQPRRAPLVRTALAAVFAIFNLPWLFVASRALSGSMWGVGRIPYLGPWIAWQILGWIFCALLAAYIIGKAVVRGGGELGAVLLGAGSTAQRQDEPLPAPGSPLSRRRFLARATYAYAGASATLATYGIWSASRLPDLTRRTLEFPTLPRGLDGLTLLHLSDLHAGTHLGADPMSAIVRRGYALNPDLVGQKSALIDISPSYIPAYLRAFRELRAPLGVVTVLGNHDRHTGEREVIRGCREAGQGVVQNECHLVERGGGAPALVGIDAPPNLGAGGP